MKGRKKIQKIPYYHGDGWFIGVWYLSHFQQYWRSVLLVKETGVPGENHRTVASH